MPGTVCVPKRKGRREGGTEGEAERENKCELGPKTRNRMIINIYELQLCVKKSDVNSKFIF